MSCVIDVGWIQSYDKILNAWKRLLREISAVRRVKAGFKGKCRGEGGTLFG